MRLCTPVQASASAGALQRAPCPTSRTTPTDRNQCPAGEQLLHAEPYRERHASSHASPPARAWGRALPGVTSPSIPTRGGILPPDSAPRHRANSVSMSKKNGAPHCSARMHSAADRVRRKARRRPQAQSRAPEVDAMNSRLQLYPSRSKQNCGVAIAAPVCKVCALEAARLQRQIQKVFIHE